ncbi:MAG TPA: hypothetical protein VFT74_03435, partial [Isosphaeraceae bacterium]|nr:hypothetical protein [Isosphaeraceae bacterium]
MNRASWSASVCVLLLIAGKAGAMPLDPRDFPSLGAMSISSGAFNSDGTPILITGGMTYTGTVSQGVAVFSFDSLTLGSVSIFGSRPIALLSRGNLIAGNLSVSGLGGAGGQGGQSLNSISGSPGLGTGGGSGATPVGGGGGGGFGGAGGQGGSSLGDSAGGPA